MVQIRDIGKADFEGSMGKMLTIEVSRETSQSGPIRTITLPNGRMCRRVRRTVDVLSAGDLSFIQPEVSMKTAQYTQSRSLLSPCGPFSGFAAAQELSAGQVARRRRAKRNAPQFETMRRRRFADRSGKRTGGLMKGLYGETVCLGSIGLPSSSDLANESADLFVLDAASGAKTDHGEREDQFVMAVWCPTGAGSRVTIRKGRRASTCVRQRRGAPKIATGIRARS